MASFWKPDRAPDSAFSGASRKRDRYEGIRKDRTKQDDDRTDRDFSFLSSYNKNLKLTISEQRRRLPIYKHREEILYLVETHAVTILVGETGSGKSTQVPQYLVEAGWTSGGQMIAVTQPRRVAAMTVASRVAEERGNQVLGSEVGYSIRFEDLSTPGTTKIKYVTDGTLLREMAQDPLLSRYSVIMVDEAHERSLFTDVLLGLLKKVQRQRRDLRIIVSSATLQAQNMANFYNKGRIAVKLESNNDIKGDDQVQVDTNGQHTQKSTLFSEAASLGVTWNSPSTFPPPPLTEAALLSVEGRIHPVQIHYLKESCSDYIQAAVEAVLSIHEEDLPGDILIFLTGQDDCEKAVSLLREEERRMAETFPNLPPWKRKSHSRIKLNPVPLYAGLPAAAQIEAVAPGIRGSRKVVVATNIAETSVTIEGVVYVIDSMFVKQRSFNPLTGLESLITTSISRASASQRAGRAGRVRPGHCFRLCTEETYLQDLSDHEVPEMQRSDLSGVVLLLKNLGIDNMMAFGWISPPPAESMVKALETLHALGALGNDALLTKPLGLRMAELPLDPLLARALIAGAEMGCAIDIATIVAMLGVQSIWAGSDSKAVLESKKSFAVVEGDLVTYLNVWKAWNEAGRRQKWSFEHFINQRSMLRAAAVRNQLLVYLKKLKLPAVSILEGMHAGLSESKKAVATIQTALASGLFLNAACLTEEISSNAANSEDAGSPVYRLARGSPNTIAGSARLRIHASSVMFRCRPTWVCFVRAQQAGAGWFEMQDLMTTTPDILKQVAPKYFKTARESEIF